MDDARTLEIILFAGEDGRLAYIEIDCCVNSYPVPDIIEVHDHPFYTHASATLLQ